MFWLGDFFYTASTERLLTEGYIPTLNGTSNILVEFKPTETYEIIKDYVCRLGNAGYTVAIAHAERYDALREIRNVVELKEQLSALIQINANTVLSPRGFWQKLWLRKFLTNELCDVVDTDAHYNSNRKCHM